MIDATIFPFFTGLFPIICAITLLVLRAGASRVFFDIVGTFQADRLIQDTDAALTVYEALYLDTFNGIQEAAQEIGDQFTDLVDHLRPLTEEIEEARIQLEKFLDMAESDMQEVAQDIIDIGQAFGFAADEAMLAGAKMAQLSGVLGAGSTPVGTEIGMMFGLISGMETDAAMQRMVNLQQQTKFMTEGIEDNMSAEEQANKIRANSIEVLNQLNTVENRSVATMEQITFVMNQFASQAKLTNESIASMAALSATLIEAGEEQGKGGRALRMMYARLGADINGSRKAVEDLGIAVADNEGNMRALSDVLVDLAAAYHTMSGEEQTALAQQVAGNRHYTRLIKLLENVDRVKELEFEATIAMFPAMDEIERRRDTELFQLQEAEAAYKTQAGILGNELLPTLTSVTRTQTVFIEQINALMEIDFLGMGNLVKIPLAFAQSAKAFLGPSFQMLLSLHNMNIALRTQAAITRALNGEKIAGMDYDKKTGTHMATEVARQRDINAKIAEEIALRNRLAREKANEGKNMTSPRYLKDALTRIDNLTTKINRNKKAQKDLNKELRHTVGITKDYENSSQKRTKAQEEEYKAAKKLRDEQLKAREELEQQMKKDMDLRQTYQHKRDGFYDREIEQEQLLATVTDRATKQRAKNFTQLTVGVAALGSAMMMLGGKNSKVMRMGMALNAAAMAAQLAKTLHSAAANIFLTKTIVTLTAAEMIRAKELGILNEVTLASTKNTNKMSVALATVLKSPALLSTAIIGLAVAFKLLDAAYNRWFKSSKNAKQDQIDLSGAMLDTSRVIEILKNKEMDINAELKEKKHLLSQIKDSQDELTKTTIAGLKDEIMALEQAKGIREFNATGGKFDEQMAKDYFTLLEKEEAVIKKYGDGGTGLFGDDSIFQLVNRTGNALKGGFAKHYGDQVNDAKKATEDFEQANITLANFIEKHQIDNYDQLVDAAERYGTSISDLLNDIDGEGNAIDNLGKTYSTVTDEIGKFANQREEMFYGFDRNNLTGDLVRQVTQQGVETLVTTTEVIMTNNFNGMTVPQVADMIIEEIEGRGNLRGYNLSTA